MNDDDIRNRSSHRNKQPETQHSYQKQEVDLNRAKLQQYGKPSGGLRSSSELGRPDTMIAYKQHPPLGHQAGQSAQSEARGGAQIHYSSSDQVIMTQPQQSSFYGQQPQHHHHPHHHHHNPQQQQHQQPTNDQYNQSQQLEQQQFNATNDISMQYNVTVNSDLQYNSPTGLNVNGTPIGNNNIEYQVQNYERPHQPFRSNQDLPAPMQPQVRHQHQQQVQRPHQVTTSVRLNEAARVGDTGGHYGHQQPQYTPQPVNPATRTSHSPGYLSPEQANPAACYPQRGPQQSQMYAEERWSSSEQPQLARHYSSKTQRHHYQAPVHSDGSPTLLQQQLNRQPASGQLIRQQPPMRLGEQQQSYGPPPVASKAPIRQIPAEPPYYPAPSRAAPMSRPNLLMNSQAPVAPLGGNPTPPLTPNSNSNSNVNLNSHSLATRGVQATQPQPQQQTW